MRKKGDLIDVLITEEINNSKKIIQNQVKQKINQNLLEMIKELKEEEITKDLQIMHLISIHGEMGHASAKKMKEIVGKKISFKEIKRVGDQCQICTMYKRGNLKIPGKLTSHIKSRSPFETIALDILGPLEIDKFEHEFTSDKIFILCITDIYSRYTEIEAIEKIDSNTIVKIFKKIWLTKFPLPKAVISDQGRQFISLNFKKILQKRKIKHILTCAYNPESNGVVERINGKILNSIRTCRKSDFEDCMNVIWRNLNCLKVRTIGYSPIEIITGRTITGENIQSDEMKRKYKLAQKQSHYKTDIQNEKKTTKVKLAKQGSEVYVKYKRINKLDPY